MLYKYNKYRLMFGTLIFAGFLSPAVFLNGCSTPAGDKDEKKENTYTKGFVTIMADEAYKPILEDQKLIYQIRYPEAEFNIIYTGEEEAYRNLINDSVPIAVVSFEPSEEHKKHFREKGFALNAVPIAWDGIVAVVNKNCPLTQLTQAQLKQILTGQIATWEQLAGNNTVNGPVVLGFNISGSGIISYFKKHYLAENEQFSANSGTFKNTIALLDSVRQHNNIIGFIPYNYISDKDDSLATAIKHDFKIISLQSNRDSSQFVLPSQSTLADSAYPLRRKIIVINHEAGSGLGTGFVIFMASHIGQRAMLKAGLVPVTMPGRLVRIIKKNI